MSRVKTVCEEEPKVILQVKQVPLTIARLFRGQAKIDGLTYGQMFARLVEIVLINPGTKS